MTGISDTNNPAAPWLAAQEGTWAKYRSEWWKLYFADDLAHSWPSQLDQPVADDNGYRWISRDDVFAIAAEASELHTAVASTVWGVGMWAFRVGRFVTPFTRNPDTIAGNLHRASAVLTADGPWAAYGAMIRGGEAWTKYVGPAYFTKFLHFILS